VTWCCWHVSRQHFYFIVWTYKYWRLQRHFPPKRRKIVIQRRNVTSQTTGIHDENLSGVNIISQRNYADLSSQVRKHKHRKTILMCPHCYSP